VTRIAIMRDVSPSLARCELTFLAREAIDLDRAGAQHRALEQALEKLGCVVERLPAEPDLPDSVFVEDTVVVVDEVAVVTRPGAASRRAETASVARALARHRPLVPMEAPGTLDGGDVMRLGRQVFVGRSSRTNEAGIEALRAALGGFGYSVTAVPVAGCLHLKSAITEVAAGTVLLNPEWVDAALFSAATVIEVDPHEPFAANAQRVGDAVVFPTAFPLTGERLRRAGLRVVTVDLSELAKAEGAVTCCSVVFESDGSAGASLPRSLLF
jgi:dimethylargininase